LRDKDKVLELQSCGDDVFPKVSEGVAVGASDSLDDRSSTRWKKQFAQLEHRGLLPRGERLVPISAREAGNTIVWQCRFDSLCAAEAALKQIEASNEHTELARKQHPMFQQSWVEFYEVLDY
jgi:hypothetical protein